MKSLFTHFNKSCIPINVYFINPLLDSRWDTLVACHPRASAFHQRGWLEALKRTYGYEPLVLTSSAPGEPLHDGIVLCHISSWLTGNRLVSLPFADHCDFLLSEQGNYSQLMAQLAAECDRLRCKYVELRPLMISPDLSGDLQPGSSYCFHELDLTPSLDHLFRGLHKDSIQRKIRRAEREQLSCEQGRSNQLIDEFYQLLLMTRRRHQLPPQPRNWFANLLECMGDNIKIRLARKQNIPVAAIVTLRHGSSIVYKYGCSDEQFHHLGGMPFLFWRIIADSKASGAQTMDFGRSDMDNSGLIAFKDKFRATKSTLTYYRYAKYLGREASSKWETSAIKQLFAMLPDALLSTAGRVLYRHMG